MAYRFLIIDTYYPRFLKKFYSSANYYMSYDAHWKALMNELFGTSDYYSRNLIKLDCEAREIVFNDIVLQQKWMEEHGSKKMNYSFYSSPLFFKILNKLSVIPHNYQLPYKILKKQIDFYRPDILYVQNIEMIDEKFLCEVKNSVKLIVGQIAYSFSENKNLRIYDLILTSCPHFVSKFRKMGIKSEYFRIAFEDTVLEKIGTYQRDYKCTFVGGISKAHCSGNELLEKITSKYDIHYFGYGVDTLPKKSLIRNRHYGEVWGKEMYKILAQSEITINRHGDVAENYAVNMRLYEATGLGAMLITDMKDNLHDLFTIGKEVVAYNNANELIELLKYYSERKTEREAIASAGQERTLTEHTYYNRMKELLNILSKYVK